MEIILVNISVFILLLPIAVGLFLYRRLARIQKRLLWMICLVALNQFLSWAWSAWIMPENNLPFFYCYILIEFLFLSVLFSELLENFIPKRITKGVIIGFTMAWLVVVIWPGNIWTYPDYLHFAESVLILVFAGSYFYKVFVESKILQLEKEFSFWLSAGLIVYFSSNTLLFLFSDLVARHGGEVFNQIWTVHALITILLYLSYTIALTCKTKPNLS